MLGLLTATGATLFASTPQASAFFNFFGAYSGGSMEHLEKLDIPEAWIKRLGSSLPAYANFLSHLRLKKIGVKEIIAPHTKSRGSVKNTLPPKSLWRNIRDTLYVVDGLARRLETPPRELLSIYRSPAYNARCAGAKRGSYHLRNNAVDLKFHCSPGKVAAMLREMRSAGVFRGGVGRYSSFTHVDTRGSNRDW